MTGWLLDTLLYTGVLIALVLVLRRPVSRHFGPQIAYALWGLPFLRLLLPPVVLPASLAPEPAAAPLPDFEAMPAAGSELGVEAAAVAPPPVPAAAQVSPLAPSPTSSAAAEWDWAAIGQVVVELWLASALAFLVWRAVMYRRMRRELLADAQPVGEVGKVRLVETPAVAAPVAFGVLDKVVALPPLFMAQPDTVARDLAIQHELQHHRGNDLLANMAAQVLLALHWFNPLAWYGWRAMRRDQEAACDARVLAGRDRDERALYAALIVDIAAGPRLALAAPMACPVLGDKSVIHRLRSMSMADITPARRRLGRGLVITAVTLALPLTASISYSVASAQQPAVRPVAPVAPIATVDPDSPEAPAAPAAPETVQGEVRSFSFYGEGPDGEPETRSFTFQRTPTPPMPPLPAMPTVDFAWGDPDDPEFERRMEEFGEQMERWGEQYGQQWEQWGERFGQQALAWSEQARSAAPEVVESCDANEPRVTADGRTRVVICQREIERRAYAGAQAGLRGARAAIAANRAIDEEVRREILRDLDEEIERIQRDHR